MCWSALASEIAVSVHEGSFVKSEGPSGAHWGLTHFVCLEGIGRRKHKRNRRTIIIVLSTIHSAYGLHKQGAISENDLDTE